MADTLIVDGVEYDMPDQFTIGEARILKRYTGMNLADLEDADPSNPDYMAAVIHIAFARKYTDVSYDAIEARVDKVELAKIDARSDEEAVPLPIATSPTGGINASSSGEDGSATGEPTLETLTPNGSGMQGSATGATLHPATSQDSPPTNSTTALTS